MTEISQIRVLVVDDHKVVRKGLATFIAVHDDLTLVGDAGNGEEAIEQCAALHPDVVLMDLVMPVMDGLQSLRALREMDGEAKVIVLSSVGGVQSKVTDALRFGASAVVSKPIEVDALRGAVEAAVKEKG